MPRHHPHDILGVSYRYLSTTGVWYATPRVIHTGNKKNVTCSTAITSLTKNKTQYDAHTAVAARRESVTTKPKVRLGRLLNTVVFENIQHTVGLSLFVRSGWHCPTEQPDPNLERDYVFFSRYLELLYTRYGILVQFYFTGVGRSRGRVVKILRVSCSDKCSSKFKLIDASRVWFPR